jgi:t-SNARE complex subunit (syntaxin)
MDPHQQGIDPLTDLEKDVQHLKECMETLHDTVHSQQDTFDSIEDAIHSTQQDAVHSQDAIVIANDYQSSYRDYMMTAATVVTGILTALFFLL